MRSPPSSELPLPLSRALSRLVQSHSPVARHSYQAHTQPDSSVPDPIRDRLRIGQSIWRERDVQPRASSQSRSTLHELVIVEQVANHDERQGQTYCFKWWILLVENNIWTGHSELKKRSMVEEGEEDSEGRGAPA